MTTALSLPTLPMQSSAAPCAAAARAHVLADPALLHPGVWRAQAGQGAGREGVVPSGFPALDAELPGGGWPVRVLTELLLPQPGVGELRLLAPLLRALAREGRAAMFFNPPATLNAPALQELGCSPGLCIVVRVGEPAARRCPGRPAAGAASPLGWAIEQALRSGQLGAVVAWPGRTLRAEALRRLQLAAQAHEGAAFLLREVGAAAQASPAPLRLSLAVAGPDALAVDILKRRGPALPRPLTLGLAPVLSAPAHARALALQRRWADAPRAEPEPPAGPGGEAGQPGARLPVRPGGPAAATL
jgi:protein ImuA